MTEPLPQGAAIGILGGGQLGRMLSVAAARLGYLTHIYEPGANPPAGHVAASRDHRGLRRPRRAHGVCRQCRCHHLRVREHPDRGARPAGIAPSDPPQPPRPGDQPGPAVREGIPARSRPCHRPFRRHRRAGRSDDCVGGYRRLGDPENPSLRLRRQGPGPRHRRQSATDALAALQGAPAIVEGFVDFSHEISVIAARGQDGSVACFDPGENVHQDGILRTTTVPAPAQNRRDTDAVLIAANILNALDYVGVLGVELFVTARGPDRQRNRPARAQFRPLDPERLRQSTSSNSTSAPSPAGRLATARAIPT